MKNVRRSTKLADFTVATKLKEYSELSELDIYSECADHLFAGVETTGDTLCFLMWHISQPSNLCIQKKLQLELRPAFLSTASDLDVHQLPYLSAVVDEGLRLFTAAANYLPRVAPREGHLVNGYFIPGGTTLSCQPYTVHRSEETYPEPWIFRPERWLIPIEMKSSGDTGRNQRYISADHMTGFLAFGKGARSCIGKK